MTMHRIVWEPELDRRIPNGQYNRRLRDSRYGVMLHYDASRNDEAALAWFADSRCKVSYHFLVLDDGSYGEIAPIDTRAWHAGYCASSDPERLPYKDANSAFIGIAAATSGEVGATLAQTFTVAWLARKVFDLYSWDPSEAWRVVTHASEAVYPPGHPKAGQRGRKIDPVGPLPRHPILNPESVRFLVPHIGGGELDI